MTLTSKQIELLTRFQKMEITGSIIYRKLARYGKDPHNRDVLNRIAEEEMNHFRIYAAMTGKKTAPSRLQIRFYSFFSFLLGPTFTIKLMERGEAAAQAAYAELANLPEVAGIRADEERHEQELITMLKEDRLNYMGSVVLGLNDALVELTGALAGLTFALQNPELIALTGSITGIAAAFSMAASEYLSTKSEDTGKHAGKASFYTGIAYLLTVLVLIMPYLLLKNVYLSLGLMLAGAVMIIAAFNFYYSVVKDEKFSRRFLEMVGLSMGVALLSFGVGLLMRKFFGIEV